MKEYAVIVDIAKKRDFTVFMTMKDSPEIVKGNSLLGSLDRIIHYFDIAYLEMFNGRRYSSIVERAKDIMGHSEIKHNSDLLIDGSGVGDALLEMMQDAGLFPYSIISHGGNDVNYKYANIEEVFGKVPNKLRGMKTIESINVPKIDLVAAGQVILEQRRLGIADSEYKENLILQLEAFKKKNKEHTGNTYYEAESEEDHDDMVSAFLIGCWWFANRKDKDDIPERVLAGKNDTAEYEPLDYM